MRERMSGYTGCGEGEYRKKVRGKAQRESRTTR